MNHRQTHEIYRIIDLKKMRAFNEENCYNLYAYEIIKISLVFSIDHFVLRDQYLFIYHFHN